MKPTIQGGEKDFQQILTNGKKCDNSVRKAEEGNLTRTQRDVRS